MWYVGKIDLPVAGSIFSYLASLGPTSVYWSCTKQITQISTPHKVPENCIHVYMALSNNHLLT